MYKLCSNNIELTINEEGGYIASLKLNGKERLVDKSPIFKIRLRDTDGSSLCLEPSDANTACIKDGCLIYTGFGDCFADLCARVKIASDDGVSWQIAIDSVPSEYAIEWIELPRLCLPRLIENDKRGGRLLSPYDEGIIISDETAFPRYEPEYPSSGAYLTFPNKLCSQFMAYLFDDVGLYIGAHDEKRALKCLDFYPCNDGLSLHIRLYSGVGYGKTYKMSYPIVLKTCTSYWKSAAEIYRTWFKNNLPKNVVRTNENTSLPEWYKSSPLIVTYPVRGIHDMDKMEPNALFPYTNALPILKRIKNDTGSQIMALLMQWEGTAPWAPPYVWPPFGGEKLFNEFRDELHRGNDLLGVYCSGFGYTKQSTLIEEYNCEEKIKNENVLKGVCHSPKNKPELGITCCPYQRYGYDICPASERGREILDEAYSPVFDSGVDYAQILDQNHGGGQYMCYAREHSHPPMPGEWMTSNMQALLTDWNRNAPNMVFGCESAASEPFIGNLTMSDNRYELNYAYGKPVPLYAYIYHEYLRNFMGNQVGCPFDTKIDTLRYCLAYSFSIGDLMTLIIAPDGSLMSHWGTRDFDNSPNMELTLKFIKNMNLFYHTKGKKYLYSAKMSVADDIKCDSITIPLTRCRDSITLPRLLSSVWESDNGRNAYIVINPESTDLSFTIGEDEYIAPALNAVLIER